MKRKHIWIGVGAIAAVGAVTALYFALTTKPEIKMRGTKQTTIEVFGTYDDPGAYASIFKTDLTDEIRTESNVDTDKVGIYQVTYSVSYKGRTSRATRTVQVVDTRAPELSLFGDTSLTLSSMDFFEEPGFSCTDNYDGDLSASVTVKTTEDKEAGTGQIIYTVSDSSGNQAEAVRDVTVKDIVNPVLTLNGPSYITLAKGEEYTENGAFAEDDLDGDITDKIITAGEVNTKKVGLHTIAYTVSDAAGNRDTVTRTVEVLPKKERKASAIYLTFDDGPSDTVTSEVLDLLEKKNVPATFFILNYDEEDTATLQRMLDDGHTIGIHGYSHDYTTIYASKDAFMENIQKLSDKLTADFGYTPFAIRFPGGSSNTVSKKTCEGVMSELVRSVSAAGYSYFDWNVDSGDASGNNVDVDTLVENVKKGLKKNRGNVILMHDTDAKGTTVKALKRIIKYARKKGYEFYAISADTLPTEHTVNN